MTLTPEREQEIRQLTDEREWDESADLLAEIDRLRAELDDYGGMGEIAETLMQERDEAREALRRIARSAEAGGPGEMPARWFVQIAREALGDAFIEDNPYRRGLTADDYSPFGRHMEYLGE